MAVSGVRSSCDTRDTNSLFSWLTSWTRRFSSCQRLVLATQVFLKALLHLMFFQRLRHVVEGRG